MREKNRKKKASSWWYATKSKTQRSVVQRWCNSHWTVHRWRHSCWRRNIKKPLLVQLMLGTQAFPLEYVLVWFFLSLLFVLLTGYNVCPYCSCAVIQAVGRSNLNLKLKWNLSLFKTPEQDQKMSPEPPLTQWQVENGQNQNQWWNVPLNLWTNTKQPGSTWV